MSSTGTTTTNTGSAILQLLGADELIAIAPALGTFLTALPTAGTNPASLVLIANQLLANLGAAEIGFATSFEGQLSTTLLTMLGNLVKQEQAVASSVQTSLAGGSSSSASTTASA